MPKAAEGKNRILIHVNDFDPSLSVMLNEGCNKIFPYIGIKTVGKFGAQTDGQSNRWTSRLIQV